MEVKQRNMEGVIENLLKVIEGEAIDFSNMDQDQLYRELASRLEDMADDALKREYMGNWKEVSDYE